MDTAAAARLAARLGTPPTQLYERVASRLLQAFPELTRSLYLEGSISPIQRLSKVSVERLGELVRSVLLFELPSLVDNELTWAYGVLPMRGVTYEHQVSMVRWFFEELGKLPLEPAELNVARELESYFLRIVAQVYRIG